MSKFGSGTISSIVEELVGSFEPIGETNYDKKCFDNIQTMDLVIADLLDDIQLMIPYKDRYEASMKVIGEYAVDFVKGLKLKAEEWLEDYGVNDG